MLIYVFKIYLFLDYLHVENENIVVYFWIVTFHFIDVYLPRLLFHIVVRIRLLLLNTFENYVLYA